MYSVTFYVDERLSSVLFKNSFMWKCSAVPVETLGLKVLQSFVCIEHIHETHIAIVNYLHKDWYENYTSIYQHYKFWHAKCATLLTVTVQNIQVCWKIDLIKIEQSNIQTPMDTTPANTAEIPVGLDVSKMVL